MTALLKDSRFKCWGPGDGQNCCACAHEASAKCCEASAKPSHRCAGVAAQLQPRIPPRGSHPHHRRRFWTFASASSCLGVSNITRMEPLKLGILVINWRRFWTVVSGVESNLWTVEWKGSGVWRNQSGLLGVLRGAESGAA